MSGGGRIARLIAGLGLVGLAAYWAGTSAKPARAGTRSKSLAAGGAYSGGSTMSQASDTRGGGQTADRGPGEEHPDGDDVAGGIRGYAIGLGLAAILTVVSFSLPHNGLIWGPAIPAALIVFAIAQMGVHLVFFLHITTGADNLNNAMALAFGCIIVFLVLAGSLWIMWHLNHNMMPMGQMMNMQR